MWYNGHRLYSFLSSEEEEEEMILIHFFYHCKWWWWFYHSMISTVFIYILATIVKSSHHYQWCDLSENWTIRIKYNHHYTTLYCDDYIYRRWDFYYFFFFSSPIGTIKSMTKKFSNNQKRQLNKRKKNR